MSGGHFDYENYRTAETFDGVWRDEEINELFHDMFCADLWGDRSGGLATALDFWLSGDVGEETYREYVARFKAKWFSRTYDDRIEFYAAKLRETCSCYERELSGEAVVE